MTAFTTTTKPTIAKLANHVAGVNPDRPIEFTGPQARDLLARLDPALVKLALQPPLPAEPGSKARISWLRKDGSVSHSYAHCVLVHHEHGDFWVDTADGARLFDLDNAVWEPIPEPDSPPASHSFTADELRAVELNRHFGDDPFVELANHINNILRETS